MNITVVGAGYVGLVTGVCLSSLGRKITLFDVDESKIDMLNNGISPIYEEDLSRLLSQCMDRMIFTSNPETAYKNTDVVILAVPTPDRSDGSANLSYLFNACNQIIEYSSRGLTVIIKSTAPIGTSDKIEKYLSENSLGKHFRVAANPEFLSQGTAVEDTLYPARIIIGSEDNITKKLVSDIYEGIDSEIIATDRRTAEMIKYASNDFLALKISYINEIANLCEIVDADVETVSYGMGLDPRIGKHYLRPGTGYGGSCFPKDTKALHWLAQYYDYELKTIKATIEVNENQKIKLFKKVKRYFENIKGLTVAVLGLAFKPGTDDLRESPSINLIRLLYEEGAIIKAWDKAASDKFDETYPNIITTCTNLADTLYNADVCIIVTEWDEVKALQPDDFASLMKTPVVIDGRNCYPIGNFVDTGVLYDSVGRRTVNTCILENRSVIKNELQYF